MAAGGLDAFASAWGARPAPREPRAAPQPVASCSGRGAGWDAAPARRRAGPARRVAARAAGEGGEQPTPEEAEEEVVAPRNPYVEPPEILRLPPRHQSQGPPGKSIEKTFVEAMFNDEVDVEDTNFWFTEPEGGWDAEEQEVLNLDEEEPDPITAANFGPGRIELAELRVGAVLTGEVTCLMFYHGVQVDLGAQYDGLIPVLRDQWADEHFQAKYGVSSGVADDFEIGQIVTVRVHRVNTRPRCRWPIQLEVLDPDVQHKLTPPDQYSVPFDLRGVRSWEEACRITGRPLPPPAAPGGWIPAEELEEARVEMGSPAVAGVVQAGSSDVSYAGRSLLHDVFDELERLRLGDLEAARQAAEAAEVSEDAELYEEDYTSSSSSA